MSCYPLITKSTHYVKSLNSLIDNIFTNSKSIPIDIGIIINDISDQLPIYTIYNSYKRILQMIKNSNVSDNYMIKI